MIWRKPKSRVATVIGPLRWSAKREGAWERGAKSDGWGVENGGTGRGSRGASVVRVE